MGKTFYTVIEEQMNNGTASVLSTVYQDEDGEKPAKDRALSKYFTVLSYAALSDIEYHAAYIIRSDGVVIGEEIFDRRTN